MTARPEAAPACGLELYAAMSAHTIDPATGEPIATHGETTAAELEELLVREDRRQPYGSRRPRRAR